MYSPSMRKGINPTCGTARVPRALSNPNVERSAREAEQTPRRANHGLLLTQSLIIHESTEKVINSPKGAANLGMMSWDASSNCLVRELAAAQ